MSLQALGHFVKYFLLLTGLIACGVALAVTDTGLENREIRPLVKFLEKEPLSENAPLVRRELLRETLIKSLHR